MLKQELNLKLQQKLSPQQIQLMKLVQLPTVAFEQRVKEEMEENPALDDQSSEYDEDYGGEQDEWDNQNDDYNDEQVIDTSDINIDDYLSDDDVPNYKTYTNNYSDDDEDKSVPYAQGESFIEFLTGQLYTYRLTEDQFKIAEFILGNIDDDGYMRRDVKSLVDDLAFSQNIYTSPDVVENLLVNYIQHMDPVGVGARNLQECLLIQLENKVETEAVELAEKLITESFDAFTKKHYSKIMAKYDVNDDELRDAISEIERLNPKPGKSFSSSSKIVEQITPDFSININDGSVIDVPIVSEEIFNNKEETNIYYDFGTNKDIEIDVELIADYPNQLCYDGKSYAVAYGLPILTDYTVIADRTWFAEKVDNGVFMSKALEQNGAFILEYKQGDKWSTYSYYSATNINIDKDNSIVYQTKNKYNEQTIYPGDKQDTDTLFIGTIRKDDSRSFIGCHGDILIFNRTLTEYELSWVKNNMMCSKQQEPDIDL